MDKWQGLKAFWSLFDIPAYEENSVPDEAEMPYITYEAKTDNIGNTLPLSAQLWYYSFSWADISQKAKEIAECIGYGHKILSIANGYIYISQGSPFAQRLSDNNSDMVKRIQININCEFLTAN